MSNFMQEKLQNYVDELVKENKMLKGALEKETIRKEDAYRRERNLEEEVKELRQTKFKRFNSEECWIFNEDGDNNLDSLVCPVVIDAEYLMALQELLYVNSMWLGLAFEEDGYFWDQIQSAEIKMALAGSEVVLEGFIKDINKGCN